MGDNPEPRSRPSPWRITLAAAAILMVTMGARQSLGLYVAPLGRSTGLGVAVISLALAVGQLLWGLVQPAAGALADRYGPARVLSSGIVVMAIGIALTPWMASGFGLVASLGVLTAAGSGAASFSVLIGAASQHLTSDTRGKAAGIINAGASLGQFIFAPLLQGLIQALGWMASLWSLALLVLWALPLVPMLSTPRSQITDATAQHAAPWQAVRKALASRSFLLLNAGFLTCGFHIAFLVTHLPGQVGLCGLPAAVASWSIALIGLTNIAGSLLAGASTQRFRSKYLLVGMYSSRVLLIGAYLLAPKTAWTFYLFAAGLGLTWLATVPPTAALVGKLFGVRHLATLFGMTMLSHQIGAFLGAYLGGLALAYLGDYQSMWYADMALAAFAALVNLPIREARPGVLAQA